MIILQVFTQTGPPVQHPTHEFYRTTSFSKCRNKNKIQAELLAFPNCAFKPNLFSQMLMHGNTLSHGLLRRFTDSLLIEPQVQNNNKT